MLNKEKNPQTNRNPNSTTLPERCEDRISGELFYCVYLKCSQCGNLSVITIDDEEYNCPLCETKYRLG